MSEVSHRASADRYQLTAVLAISLVVFLVEVAGGIITNSLALLADAGHVFGDVVGVGLALGAVWLGARPATDRRTFGFYRAEILAAALNAVLLLGVAGYVLFHSWRRLTEEPEILSGPMFVIAALGLGANLASAALLRRRAAESLNVRAAYLEVLADALGSVAVLVAAAVIVVTGIRVADAIASAFIGLLIVPRTWHLLREAVDILLEATPRNVELAEVRRLLLGTSGVTDVHDLHAWTIASGLNVVSAHVVLREGADPGAVLDALATRLSHRFDIEHSTFQLETSDRRRLEQRGHR